VKALRKASLFGGDEENRTPIRSCTGAYSVRDLGTFAVLYVRKSARNGQNVTQNVTQILLIRHTDKGTDKRRYKKAPHLLMGTFLFGVNFRECEVNDRGNFPFLAFDIMSVGTESIH